jgi:hypothetical protein
MIVDANRKVWIKSYHKEVLAAFNKRRSCTQEWCKDEYFKLLAAGKTPPDPKLILKCSQRKINPQDDDEMEAFAWYWDHLLPGVGGAKHCWSPIIRHHNLISKAYLEDNESKLCIPASSEAFIALIYEGCFPKWNAIHEWQLANPGLKFSDAKEERKKPIYKSKFFETATGQKMFGGVPPETLIYFNELKGKINKARTHKNNIKKTLQLEQACLDLVQKKANVVVEQEKEEEPSTKKRKETVVTEIQTFGDEE